MPSWLIGVVMAAALLLVLWPTRRSGLRLLRTWGIPYPRPDQVTVAVRYLRQRRILYVIGFLLLPPLVGLFYRGIAPGVGEIAPLLVAMLVAETVATLRSAGGVRIARLDRRSWRDLVPRWAIAVMAGLILLTVGLAGYGLTREPGPGVLEPAYGGVLGYLVLCVAMVGLLVHLAVRRPSVPDEAVDIALRMRTARVAVGLGFGWVGGALIEVSQRLYELQVTGPDPSDLDWFGHIMEFTGLVTLVVSVACWVFVAQPGRRVRAST